MIIGCENMKLCEFDSKNKKVNEIDEELKNLQKTMENLEKQRLDALVNEEKAFHCKKCDRIIIISAANNDELQYKKCYRCLREMKEEEKRNEIIKKLKYGTVIDIDFTSYGTEIQTICVHKGGISYEIQSIGDEQYPSMYIDSETEEDIDIKEQELKPWMKKRSEKPLW